jgi:hypothetical protein
MKTDQTPSDNRRVDRGRDDLPQAPAADVLSAFGVHLLRLPVEQALGYARRHPGTLVYLAGVLIAGGAPFVSQAAALLAA